MGEIRKQHPQVFGVAVIIKRLAAVMSSQRTEETVQQDLVARKLKCFLLLHTPWRVSVSANILLRIARVLVLVDTAEDIVCIPVDLWFVARTCTAFSNGMYVEPQITSAKRHRRACGLVGRVVLTS